MTNGRRLAIAKRRASLMETERQDVCFEEVITAGGGAYKGIQRGCSRTGIPDLVLFNDPLTGTTLALVANKKRITVYRVRAKIERSRDKFLVAQLGVRIESK